MVISSKMGIRTKQMILLTMLLIFKTCLGDDDDLPDGIIQSDDNYHILVPSGGFPLLPVTQITKQDHFIQSAKPMSWLSGEFLYYFSSLKSCVDFFSFSD